MNIVDPNAVKKASKSAKARDPDFEAEPGLEKPSQEWLKAQVAYLKLTMKPNGHWGSKFPALDTYSPGPESKQYWDEDRKQYYVRSYLRFKVTYRYYRGKKKKSYITWPRYVTPGWNLSRWSKEEGDEDGLYSVVTESGTATYAALGTISFGQTETYYGTQKEDREPVMALWKSTGTQKPRRTRNGG